MHHFYHLYHLYHLYHRNISTTDFVIIIIDYHWLSLTIHDYHWLLLIIWKSEKRWITDWLTQLLTTWNQEMLTHLKKRQIDLIEQFYPALSSLWRAALSFLAHSPNWWMRSGSLSQEARRDIRAKIHYIILLIFSPRTQSWMHFYYDILQLC